MKPSAEVRFLTGAGTYTDTISSPDALWVHFVRSSSAHGRLIGVDTTAAMAAPGVVGVYTAADLDIAPISSDIAALDQRMVRTMLASDKVRFVGEPVAAVVASTRNGAADAAELVVVDVEPLDAVIDPEAAAHNTTVLHDAAGTNQCYSLDGGSPIDFDQFEVVVRARLINQRVAACPMEGRAVLAAPDGDRLNVWISAQGSHPMRDKIAEYLGYSPDRLRVICPDVGGGFGAKAYPHPEEALVVWLADKHRAAVRWTDQRTESMLALGHGRGQVQHVTLAGDADGTLRAYRLDVIQDAGAYPRLGGFLPFMAQMMMSGGYRFEQLEFHGTSVVTNTNPTVAYRGAGRPEATAAIERAVDLFAAQAGIDPSELRRKNLLRHEVFPYQPGTGATYDAADLPATLESAMELVDYRALRTEQHDKRVGNGPKQMGIGMATYIEITAASPWPEDATVSLAPDGIVRLLSGTCPQGQGHERTWKRVASRVLGVPTEEIEVTFADSDSFPTGTVTAGSRSAQIGGIAVHRAASMLAESIKRVAAELLEANAVDLELGNGRVSVVGSAHAGIALAELAATLAEPLRESEHFTPAAPTYGSGTHVAVVEVDTETGEVVLQRLVAVDDAGTILDSASYEGQVHGGIAQGVGQALFEEMVYAPDGTPMSTSFADYLLPSITELPMYETADVITPRANELGVGGIGEAGAVGATPAVQNAVIDALSHLGIRHLDLPVTPHRVWQAIRATH